MTQVPAALADFARRLFVHEAGECQRTQDFAEAMERVCQSLQTRLAPLLSDVGVNALLGRAITLAGRDFSFLPGLGPVTDCSLEGLRHALEGREPGEAA